LWHVCIESRDKISIITPVINDGSRVKEAEMSRFLGMENEIGHRLFDIIGVHFLIHRFVISHAITCKTTKREALGL
jgi:hypothetical protein